MSKNQDPQPDPVERLQDLPRILAAMRSAVAEALRQHARNGLPVAAWRGGQVVWIAPEDIPEIE